MHIATLSTTLSSTYLHIVHVQDVHCAIIQAHKYESKAGRPLATPERSIVANVKFSDDCAHARVTSGRPA